MDENNKDEEEISIDFSKMKGFFKRKKDEPKQETAMKEEEVAKEKKDDEISIDFGKIKGFFKSKKDEHHEFEHVKSEERKSGEDEIHFDFKKIKNVFKASKDGKESEDEVAVDWGKITNFFRKYGIIFIALIPLILSIYVRVLAVDLPVTDEWAANSVMNAVRTQIKASIDQQYPNLPDANKDVLIENELQKILSQNKGQIEEQIKATSNYFKAFFQDESGKKYMADIDPYYWSRYANNVVEHGHPGDILKEGKPFDTYQLAPLGRFVFPDMFHVYASAYFYKILNFFSSGLTLMNFMFYLIVFFSAVCVLIVFFIGRKIAGNAGGFFAGLMMAVNAAFLSRTLHPDNDVWVVFFPLIITWLFLLTFDSKSALKIATFSSLAGFFTGLFTLAWSGWWYIFDFLLGTIALTLLYLILINVDGIRKNIKSVFSNTPIRNILIVGIIYFASSALFVTFFSGFNQFVNSFLGPLSFPSIKAPVDVSLWPNVLTTVAELNEGSINGIINSIGGQFLFFISLVGLILAISRSEGMKKFDYAYIIATALFYGLYFLLRRGGFDISVFGLIGWIMLPILLRIGISVYKKDSSYNFKLSILLSFWVVSTIFASIKGIRFTVLLAPAFSIAFGASLGKIYLYLSKSLTKGLKIHKAIVGSTLIIVLLMAYAAPIKGAIAVSGSDLPIVNDAWYNSLNSIKQNSDKNAIITSWWDFGHHFKVLADRRVTFDGTTQTSPAAHWVGKILMTSNEKQAMGILRMLDCGSNSAYNELYKMSNDTHLTMRILNQIILLDKKAAEKKLKELKYDEKQAEKILSFTHCEPPEAYFIASDDMIGKSGVWGHFGSWNFERADIWENARKMPQEEAVDYMIKKFNYTKENAENIYFEVQSITSDSQANSWVAPWPGYAGTTDCSKNSEGIYSCSNGLQVNLSNYDVFAVGQQGTVRPKAAAFTTENGMLVKEFNGTADFGITLIPKNKDTLLGVLSSKELTGGMFTRMFFGQGHGLKYFEPFNHERGLTGTDVYVYKVDWEGKNATVVNDYVNFLNPAEEEEIIENISLNNTNNS